MRDLIIALEAHNSKCYHLGMGRSVSRSSLARANQDRDYHIFEEYAYHLVNEAGWIPRAAGFIIIKWGLFINDKHMWRWILQEK